MEIGPSSEARRRHTRLRHPSDAGRLLWRRIAAGLVDLALIIGACGAAAALVVERFVIIRAGDGGALFAAADQTRINELAGSLSRGYELGDTLLAFSTRSVLIILASIILAVITVGVLVPILTGGQSVGKMIFGLRVVGEGGSPISPARHVIRTAVGLADLMPLIVPGLTGFAFAVSNPANQRIGDRVAKTVVVDCREPRPTSSDITVKPAVEADVVDHGVSEIPEVPTARATVRPSHVWSSRSEPKLNSDVQTPDHGTSNGPIGVDRTTREAPRHPHHGDRIAMSDSVNVEGQQDPTVANDAARRVPVEERPTNPYPKPSRPEPSEQTEAPPDQVVDTGEEAEAGSLDSPDTPAEPKKVRPGYDSLALPESSLSDMPLTNTALFEALGLSPDDVARLNAADQPVEPVAADTGQSERQSEQHGEQDSEQTDLVPDIASAPRVPGPQPRERRAAVKDNNPPAPVTPSAQIVRQPDPVSIQAAPIVQPDTVQHVSHTEQQTAQPRQGSSPAPDKRAPIWSEDWESWIYWDTTLRTWFRHDEASNNWLPMDD